MLLCSAHGHNNMYTWLNTITILPYYYVLYYTILTQVESHELNKKSEGTWNVVLAAHLDILHQCCNACIFHSGFPLLGPRGSDRESS